MRVLVVDDNIDSLEVVAELVGLWGHEVRMVQEALQALPAALEFRPDCVLLDLGMPKMDGLQVAQLIRQNSLLDSVVLAAMTGHGMEKNRARTRAAGFDIHLLKPIDFQQLKTFLDSPPTPSPRPKRRRSRP
jgi:CheY-like chemotaxis protein